MATCSRVFVKAIDDEFDKERETVVVPIASPQQTVADLTKELLNKLYIGKKQQDRFELRLFEKGVLLDETSIVGDVIRNDDFLIISPKTTHKNQANLEGSVYDVHHQQVLLTRIQPVKCIEIDGNFLDVEDLINTGMGLYHVKLSEDAVKNVIRSRKIIDDIVEGEKTVYGVNTGFGRFANVRISKPKVIELQENLIRSHAACVGPPLSLMRTRMLLTLRINTLAKGFSGARPETIQQMIDALNASCLSYVPEKGTVGASGDLGPLSHLALGLMGEGKMWSPKTGWGNALEILNANGLKPIKLQAKEGIALINGTQFICALGCEALYRAEMILKQATIIAALSIDVLQGTPKAFDRDIHINRPHAGQMLIASRLRALLDSNVHPSQIRESHKDCSRVQDPYTMRCVPQVYGVVHDTLTFARSVLTVEINSATDNPMVFANRGETISGGNFHGEYPAKVLDYLAIGIHEISNMSERRLERLIHPAYSELPAFLVKEGGLNSGFMLAQCTAASLVSENKVLTHPSSVDSITTSAGTEDHVSMGGFAARKALTVVEHVEHVVAIELLAACQALEFHRPKKTTAPLEEVYKVVRSVVPEWNKDRFLAPDITSVTQLLQEGKIWEVVEPYITAYEDVLSSTTSNSTHTKLSSSLRPLSPKETTYLTYSQTKASVQT